MTDCHPLGDDGGMACLSYSRKHLAGVSRLTPRVEGDGHFLPLVFWGLKHVIYITLNSAKKPNDRVRTSYYYYMQSILKHTFLELDSPFFRHKHRATEVRTGEILFA